MICDVSLLERRLAVKPPCVANLNTARALLEHGVVGEGAETLVDLRRCAQEPGCEDWNSCSSQIEETWRTSAEAVLPEARPRPSPAESVAGDSGDGSKP
jgi:hypothetical protein